MCFPVCKSYRHPWTQTQRSHDSWVSVLHHRARRGSHLSGTRHFSPCINFAQGKLKGLVFGYSESNMNHMNMQTHGSRFFFFFFFSQCFPNHRTQHLEITAPPTPGFIALAPRLQELIISMKRGQDLAHSFLLHQPQTCGGVGGWGTLSISGCSKTHGSAAQWARRSAGLCSSSEPLLHSIQGCVEVTLWPDPATIPCCGSGSRKGER